MNLTPEQVAVVDSRAPVLVVLGGAGTGKTTTAAALVRRSLQAARAEGRPERALFLSFSRSSVDQVMSRAEAILGVYAASVEVTTFHALAWRLVGRWGNAIGLQDPALLSSAEKKLFGMTEGLGYDDLIPAALRITSIAAVSEHLQNRWTVLVVDEFQDTSDTHWEFVEALRGSARLVLLGDMNQCIYRNLPNSAGVGPRRLEAAMSMEGAERLDLPDVSHRDPTQVIPAAATAVRDRDFSHAAIKSALGSGALEIVRQPDPTMELTAVLEQIDRLRQEELEVGVFSHHIDSTASLSDGLTDAGVAHHIVGLPEAVDAAIQAQYAMVDLACGGADFERVLRHLAIFVTACERGSEAPALARMIAGLAARPSGLNERLQAVEQELVGARSLGDAFDASREAHIALGLSRGGSAWSTASRLLAGMLGPRVLRADGFPDRGVDHLQAAIRSQHLALLTSDQLEELAPVQLMGLYQTKGREVDAAIVILRAGDFYGREPEPMSDGSKLLYVLLTRARKKTIVLAVGNPMRALVAPLVALG